MSVDFSALAAAHYSAKPSVLAPSLTNAQFELAVSLATKLKFGGIAEPHEAELFHKEFTGLQQTTDPPITPQQFSEAVDALAKLSYVYHDRPPSMREVALFHDKTPAQQRDYFGKLPDKYHPDLTAGEMVAKKAMADTYALKHLGRNANRMEARFLHHGNMGPDQADAHYRFLAEDRDSKLGSAAGAVQDASQAIGGQNPSAAPQGPLPLTTQGPR